MKSLLIAFIGFISGCERFDEVDVEPIAESFINPTIPAIDKEVIENPYDLKNMQQALGKIKKMTYRNKKNFSQDQGKNSKSEPQSLNFTDFQITANYKYVKFSPTTVAQEQLLRSDPTLVLADYPLDYQDADHYYIVTGNPIPSEDDILEYYTSVPLNKAMPAVPFEEITLMYLPDEDPYFDNAVANGNPTIEGVIYTKEDLINHLYTVAYVESGNGNLLPPDILETDNNGVQQKFLGISFRSKWTPSGSAQIWDENITTTTNITETRVVGYQDIPCDYTGFNEPVNYITDSNGNTYGESGPSNGMQLEQNQSTCRVPIYQQVIVGTQTTVGGYTPLVGAQILIRDTFTLSNEITDASGRFTFKGIRPAVRYLIQWERHNYSIRDGGWQASLKGPKMREKSWNVKIRDGEDAYHANIHRGAHMYYYANLPGLTGPPTPNGVFSQMKIAAVETNEGASSHAPIKSDLSLNLLSRVRVKAFGDPTERVIGVMIHELAHAAHTVIDEGSYDKLVREAYILPEFLTSKKDDNKRLMESYARHIEITYVNEFYHRLGFPEYIYRGDNLQDQPISPQIHYTTLLYDLRDIINQRNIDAEGQVRTFFNPCTTCPIDNVEGFTLLEIEQALIGARDLNDYRLYLESLNKDSNADIRELFNNW